MSFTLDPAIEQTIISALANSVNPNNEERKAAEASLKQAQHTVGYASALLKISGDQSLKGKFNVDINHAASIQFGQLVEIHWKFKDVEHAQEISGGIDFIVIDEGDKQCVRENLLGAMNEQVNNKPIVKQYIRSLKHICIKDYPEKFPILFDQIMNYLNQNNP